MHEKQRICPPTSLEFCLFQCLPFDNTLIKLLQALPKRTFADRWETLISYIVLKASHEEEKLELLVKHFNTM